jgi:hypothetical protein
MRWGGAICGYDALVACADRLMRIGRLAGRRNPGTEGKEKSLLFLKKKKQKDFPLINQATRLLLRKLIGV